MQIVQRIKFAALVLFAVVLCALRSYCCGDQPASDEFFPGKVRLILPPVVYATPGIECNVYFDNIILAINPRNYAFDVTCPKGLQFQERWAYTPTEDEVGEYPIVIEARDDANEVVARGKTTIRVAAEKSTKGSRDALDRWR